MFVLFSYGVYYWVWVLQYTCTYVHCIYTVSILLVCYARVFSCDGSSDELCTFGRECWLLFREGEGELSVLTQTYYASMERLEGGKEGKVE